MELTGVVAMSKRHRFVGTFIARALSASGAWRQRSSLTSGGSATRVARPGADPNSTQFGFFHFKPINCNFLYGFTKFDDSKHICGFNFDIKPSDLVEFWISNFWKKLGRIRKTLVRILPILGLFIQNWIRAFKYHSNIYLTHVLILQNIPRNTRFEILNPLLTENCILHKKCHWIWFRWNSFVGYNPGINKNWFHVLIWWKILRNCINFDTTQNKANFLHIIFFRK